jgi:hypothetical protein
LEPKFKLGDKVQINYIDAIGHRMSLTGLVHRGPLGENEPYWYVMIGGIAVLFPEKDIQNAQG